MEYANRGIQVRYLWCARLHIPADPAAQATCVGVDAAYDLVIGSVSGYSDPVTLSASGNPAGTFTNFSVNPVVPEGDSILTIGNTGSAAAGDYVIEILGNAPTSTHTTTIGLELFDSLPGSTTLLTPVNEAINQPLLPTFTWSDAPEGGSYTIEIATDPAFNNIIISSTISGTSYTPASELDTSSTYYWRVQPSNACGTGNLSAVFRFTTYAALGDCGPGSSTNIIYSDDFESGAPGWSIGGNGSTWSLGAGVSPGGPHSGTFVYHADDVSSVSDQYLISPAVSLPNSGTHLTLKFWNYQEIEDSTFGCYDAGVLEISSNGGANWTRLRSELLTDPYHGEVDSGYDNPLAGENTWCGDPQDWLNSVVDVDSYAGQTIQFRWRLATDSTVGHPGWDIDDVVVQSCQPLNITIPAYLPLVQKGGS
jgi:lysyl endopeptidase